MPRTPEERAKRAAKQLKAETLLSDRQAEAYAYRAVVGVDRQTTAEELGVSKSRVDNALREAREKIDRFRHSVSVLDQVEQAEREYGPPE